MTERPAIGICAAASAPWGVWSQPAAVLPFAYIDAIHAAGGSRDRPADPAWSEEPDEMLDRSTD